MSLEGIEKFIAENLTVGVAFGIAAGLFQTRIGSSQAPTTGHAPESYDTGS